MFIIKFNRGLADSIDDAWSYVAAVRDAKYAWGSTEHRPSAVRLKAREAADKACRRLNANNPAYRFTVENYDG